MATTQPHHLEGVLSSSEIAVVQVVQDLYGAEAKTAAAELAEAIGLQEEARDQFIGGIALSLDGLDFEQRCGLAKGLREVTSLVGEQTLKTTVEIGDILVAAKSLSAIRPDPAESEPDEPEDDTDASNEQDSAPIEPLTRTQKTWLGRFLPDESMEQVEAMTYGQRLGFISGLASMYKDLKIRGSADTKNLRSKQMIALFEGKSANEIGDLSNSNPDAVRATLSNMSKNIQERAELDDIQAIIADPPTYEPIEWATDTEELTDVTTERSHEQTKWYDKIYPDKSHRYVTEELTTAQQQYIADNLSTLLEDYLIKSQGEVKTERRTTALTMFVMGKPADEIAAALDRPLGIIKTDLHDSAVLLGQRTPTPELKAILNEVENLPHEEANESKSGNDSSTGA
ncbi:MAG: hypothetical protein AAB436_01700 [Patescibacteria group bacterium]